MCVYVCVFTCVYCTWSIKAINHFCNQFYTLQIKVFLLASVIPWRTFNIHETFPFCKRSITLFKIKVLYWHLCFYKEPLTSGLEAAVAYWAFKHLTFLIIWVFMGFLLCYSKMLQIFSLYTQICDDRPEKWGEKDIEALILVLSYADRVHNKGLSVTGDSGRWREVWGVCVCVCVCVDGGLDQELFRRFLRSWMCKAGVFLRLMFCLAHRWSNLHLSPNRPSVHWQPGFMCTVMTTSYTINRCSFC